MGYTTVRGITAEKWKSSYNRQTVYNNISYITNATMYYYFTANDWDMTFSNYNNSNVVLRMEIFGTYAMYNFSKDTGSHSLYWKTETFDTWYDVVAFWNGTLDDNDFSIPANWREDCTISSDYCESKPNQDVCSTGPSLPQLPPAFRSTVECKFLHHNNWLMTVDEYYDYVNNRLRIIEYPYRYSNSNTTYTNYTTHYLENGVLLWKWQQDNRDSADPDSSTINQCTLQRVEQSSGDTSLWWDSSSEHVTNTADFFHFMNNLTVEHYYGTQNVRQIPCNVWKHDIEHVSTTGDDGTYEYSANMTVTYYFMQDSYKSNAVYGDYDIPVRCEVTGTAYFAYGDYESTYDFDNRYDYINFVPYMPDEFWFIPPSNASCNVTKFCNDLPDVDEYALFAQLCNATNTQNGIATTQCYISSCGEISDVVSGNGRGTTEKCKDHSHSIPGYMWVVVVIAFLFGLGIGIFYHYKSKRSGQFRQIEDDGL